MVWQEQKQGKVENRAVVGEDGKKVGQGQARAFEAPSRSNRAGRSFEAGQGEIKSVVSKANPNASIVQGFWNPEPLGEPLFLMAWFVPLLWMFDHFVKVVSAKVVHCSYCLPIVISKYLVVKYYVSTTFLNKLSS